MKKHRQKLRQPLRERFYAKVSPEPNSGCWLWTGATKELGYGVIGLGRREDGTAKAHRVSYELHKGPTGGLCVLHECDNPACVNPDHLRLGTLKDNARDCVSRGRNFIPDNRGSNAKWARLNEEKVRNILTRRVPGTEYARLYGVSKSAVYQIWRGNNWRSLGSI